MKRKAFLIGLILCLATASAFAWAVIHYFGSVKMNAQTDLSGGDIIIGEQAEVELGDVDIPILASKQGTSFTTEIGTEVTPDYVLTSNIMGADAENLTLTVETTSDDPLKDCLRIATTYDGKTTACRVNQTPIKIGKLYAAGQEIKIRVWYEGTDTSCTNDNLLNSNGIPLTFKFDAY